MNTQQQLAAVAEQVGDMTDSANGAKGAVFAATVSALFALDGLRDLGRRLIDAMPAAHQYGKAVDALHANVEGYILDRLPEEERQEARNYATRMFNEQKSLHERIAQERT